MLFKEFYNNFILEGVLDSVPRKVMDMSTSSKDLPEHEPYGFWMDKSGNFMAVRPYGHENALQRITSKAMFYLQDQGVKYRPSGTRRDLLDEGWLRIVLTKLGIYYQSNPNMEVTQSQLKMLNIMKEQYEKRGIARDNVGDL